MLPEDVLMDILVRLPMKTIIHCKSVCKIWHGIISSPDFVNLHISRSRECLLYHNLKTFNWLEIERDEADIHINPVKILDNNCPLLFQIGLVNGLFCYWDPCNRSIHVMNPVLDEYMTLPRAPEDLKQLDIHYGRGYGFGVSSAGEYKVIQIRYSFGYRKAGFGLTEIYPYQIDVYTLGKDHWRSLGLTSFNLKRVGRLKRHVLYLNNHLYWQSDYGLIFDFDLNRETFELFPLPPVRSEMFGVMKGMISCLAWCSSGVDVWVMKGEAWYKEITINKKMNPLFFDPHMGKPECYIHGTGIMLMYDGFKRQLVAYCVDTDTVVPLNMNGNVQNPMAYRPSFLTLHNFGSDRVHAM